MNVIEGDVKIKGKLICESFIAPAASVGSGAIDAEDPLDAEKLQHDHLKTYAQEVTTNAAAETRILHKARNAGVVQDFEVGLVTPPDTAAGSSGRTATIDLKKNGASILSATVTLNSTSVAYASTAAALGAGATYAAGDVFTVVVTVGGSAGTHAKGVFAQGSFREVAAA